MSASVSMERLQRIFAKDKKALKEIQKVFRFATALESWTRNRNDHAESSKDAAIRDLRESLGDEHFTRIANRVHRMIEKEGERVAVD